MNLNVFEYLTDKQRRAFVARCALMRFVFPLHDKNKRYIGIEIRSYSQTEIARICGISQKVVCTRLQSLKEKGDWVTTFKYLADKNYLYPFNGIRHNFFGKSDLFELSEEEMAKEMVEILGKPLETCLQLLQTDREIIDPIVYHARILMSEYGIIGDAPHEKEGEMIARVKECIVLPKEGYFF